jgi:hypothetical protein
LQADKNRHKRSDGQGNPQSSPMHVIVRTPPQQVSMNAGHSKTRCGLGGNDHMQALRKPHRIENGSHVIDFNDGSGGGVENQCPLEREAAVIRRRMNQAYTDKLDGKIPEDFWNRSWAELQAEEQRLQAAIDQCREPSTENMLTVARTFELAQKAHSIYLTQDPAEQAKLLKLVLLNCRIDEVNIYPEYKMPFKLIAENQDWSGRADLNRGPPAPKAGALPGCATPRHVPHLDSKRRCPRLPVLLGLGRDFPGLNLMLHVSSYACYCGALVLPIAFTARTHHIGVSDCSETKRVIIFTRICRTRVLRW